MLVNLRPFLILLSFSVSCLGQAAWRFHFEAEKGDTTVSIAKNSLTLEAYLLRIPSYCPDPLDKNAVVSASSVRQLGAVSGHRILELQVHIEKQYYSDLYVLLIETDPERYLPIYAQLYNRMVRTPELASFSVAHGRCIMQIIMRYSGTAASRTTDELTVTVEPSNEINLRCDRKT